VNHADFARKGFDRLRAEYAEHSPFPSEKLKQKAAAEADPVRKQIFDRLAASELADLSRTSEKMHLKFSPMEARPSRRLQENALMRVKVGSSQSNSRTKCVSGPKRIGFAIAEGIVPEIRKTVRSARHNGSKESGG